MALLFVIVVEIVSACAVFASTADWISADQSMLLELVVPLVVTETPELAVLLLVELTLVTLPDYPLVGGGPT